MRVDDKALWGNGAWIGNSYVLEHCPICNERVTFAFHGGEGFWQCASCDGIGTWDELREILSKRDNWMDRLERLDAPEAPNGLIPIAGYKAPDDPVTIGTGFSFLDNILGGFPESGVTVLTGRRGEGKSTLAGQLALNAISAGRAVCFYSGELNAAMFRAWVFQQAAGPSGVEAYPDRFGAIRYRAREDASRRIARWLGNRLLLSDNTTRDANEHRVIFERFKAAQRFYGCGLMVVDNLMTTHYSGVAEADFFRRQSMFVNELVDFSGEINSHILLVAHPRKGEGGDMNDRVAGTADITNRAHFVVKVEKAKPEDGCASIVSVSKNRSYGTLGDVRFDYDVKCRRFNQRGGSQITRYGWEDLP